MALATRCPYCHTAFRVVQDQLKLFNGVVRCGNCRQIFNGVEQLLPEDIAAPAFMPERAGENASRIGEISVAQVPPERDPSYVEPVEDLHLILSTEDEAEPVPAALAATPNPAFAEDIPPARRQAGSPEPGFPALPDLDLKPDSRIEPRFAEYQHLSSQSQPDGREDKANSFSDTQFPQILQAKQAQAYSENDPPLLEEVEPEPEAEPGFVQRARRQQRYGRIWRIVMFVGVLVMLPGVLLQTIDVFHDPIAVSFPPLKPALEQVCQLIECQTGLAKQIDQVTAEVSELHAPGNGETAYALSLVLRNRSSRAQVWPSIELTLNDAAEKPIARRVFGAEEFLPALQAAQGFGASSEQSIKLVFELEQIKPSGYRVYLFYP